MSSFARLEEDLMLYDRSDEVGHDAPAVIYERLSLSQIDDEIRRLEDQLAYLKQLKSIR
jgi:hypothetical protein